ncbi:tRNA (guanine46-N7-)-methyltransferase [Serinicoccus hydrothermalis]|uniref:tRNA (guanine-N(7)-)-methyltransferase n=1 Tax=Serinicoccus hydrothermalis TaxID=1758689 RepID=A0A1B1N7P2_9MICO|nr:tRNA (guanosine(46)-N7)-methyltransferase TrmB [Serinicoccus hydrothermalis]ANS77453.1 tRNA (guanine46-N7-)-methyltransferase [Serinicoccus hydrothermalis]
MTRPDTPSVRSDSGPDTPSVRQDPPKGHQAHGHPAVGPRPLARTRSFTRRGGRMLKDSHQAAWDRYADALVLEVPRPHGADGSTAVHPAYRIDPEQVFGRAAPLVVEIGSGSGDALVHAATTEPGWDFLALEVWRPGIGHALAKMGAEPLTNVRFVEADAALALQSMLPGGSAHEVWTFFPDPWPKNKHHKRRLVAPDFAGTVADLVPPGGLWRLATDWADYADHMRAVLDGHTAWELVSTERAPLRPMTRFERRGIEAGREIADLAYRRV